MLAAARNAVAEHGLNASYHQIAREAGVGVGTVYRHYPDRDHLLRAVLLEVLIDLIHSAERALEQSDSWQAFTSFFIEFTHRAKEHAGLSDSFKIPGGEDVDEARDSLRQAIERLTTRAQADGHLRREARWQDVVFLAHGAAAAASCLLEPSVPEDQLDRNLGVIIAGLRS